MLEDIKNLYAYLNIKLYYEMIYVIRMHDRIATEKNDLISKIYNLFFGYFYIIFINLIKLK